MLDSNSLIQIFISNIIQYKIPKHFIVGEKYKITINKSPKYLKEKINIKISDDKIAEISGEYLIAKSSGRDCLTAFTKNINSTICFHIENKEIILENNTILNLEFNSSKQLYFGENASYKSNNPQLISVDDKGIIRAKLPGKANITVSGLNKKIITFQVLSIPNNGLINNNTLKINNADNFKNLMIVAHPDDETLWGGSNLCKDKYFVVCLTNGHNFKRSNDFKKILEFSNNGGIILDYPDKQDYVQDKWLHVTDGIIKDLITILNYKHWDKIVTHEPEGPSGHYHHRKISEYVTGITRKLKIFENLYYFGKLYPKGQIPKNLPRITEKELEAKMKLISLYKSVIKDINAMWIHMVPYENWILASNWRKNE
jgi:LmbE family N-acetylglucosaminyl deacetylase